MSGIIAAKAWNNNEVGYLVWKTDGRIEGCLGFMVTRIMHDAAGAELGRRILPAWVAFETQSNRDWEEQDTSVWPIQKFSWRDLTVRRSRDTATLRAGDFHASYEIQPVGLAAPGRAPVAPSPTARYLDDEGRPRYQGQQRPLYLCGPAMRTNMMLVSRDLPGISVAFTNGILSTQNLRKQLDTPSGARPSAAQLKRRIASKGDTLRSFLAADVLPLMRRFFDTAARLDGSIFLALYELADAELIELISSHADRITLILATAGRDDDTGEWDTTNAAARSKLRPLLGDRLIDRMFNTSSRIGHNKFGVILDSDGKPHSALTGSTNWTPTGLCGQTNNAILVEDAAFAESLLGYWQMLREDEIPVPDPISAPNSHPQSAELRIANGKPDRIDLQARGTATLWYAPNTPQVSVPRSKPATPPDLEEVFEVMSKARQAILFLAFYPAKLGARSVIAEAVKIAQQRPDLLVMGAISAPDALPNFVAKENRPPGSPPPAIFRAKGAPRVLFLRAAAIDDPVGDFEREILTTGHAIIHDKVVVVDPLSDEHCAVITGSHNLGFKASYANDENLVILRGRSDLATAFAVHVLDVHDHFRFRAKEAETAIRAAGGKRPPRPTGQGFLRPTDGWQDDYLAGKKGDEAQYFLGGA